MCDALLFSVEWKKDKKYWYIFTVNLKKTAGISLELSGDF